jgi:Fe-S cluster assembly ATP-binding protein
MLKVKGLKASIENKEILKGVDLVVKFGEVHVLMGPNGSGKSTLAAVIGGHPNYRVDSGQLTVDSKDIRKLTPDKRAKLGIFLGMQHPVEVPGVSVFAFLRKAKSARSMKYEAGIMGKRKNHNSKFMIHDSASEFRGELKKYMSELKLPEDFLRRSLNEGFSGGEKKRNEILQMMALKPKLVILDEIDSGLDVDGLKLVASALKRFALSNPRCAIILITHYARILKYLKADHVHVMVDGKIVKSGKMSLAKQVEDGGYASFGTRSDLNVLSVKV